MKVRKKSLNLSSFDRILPSIRSWTLGSSFQKLFGRVSPLICLSDNLNLINCALLSNTSQSYQQGFWVNLKSPINNVLAVQNYRVLSDSLWTVDLISALTLMKMIEQIIRML